MSYMGKLEGRIKIPTGGWDTTVGAGTATIAAGTYYISSADSTSEDFLAALETVFAAAASTTCSITISAGENGTGIVTITFGSAKAISWVDVEVRDLLGFAANSASATTHIGTRAARAVWLPSCHYRAPEVPSLEFKGLPYTDTRMVMNKAGYAWHVAGQMHYQMPIEWPAVTAAKTRISQESTVNTSFERFWRDNVFGSASWAKPGGPVRLYPNAADDATYVEYRVMEPLGSYEPQPLLEGLPTGPHRVAMRLLAVGDDPADEARATIGVSLLTSGNTDTDGLTFTSASVSPGADRLLLLGFVYSQTTVADPTGIAGNGLTWVQVTTRSLSGTGPERRLAIYRAMGSSPSAGTIVATWAANITAAAWALVELTNVNTTGTNGSGAVVQSGSAAAAGTDTTQTVTLSAFEHANNVNVSFAAVTVGTGVTPDADFAELADTASTTPVNGIEAEWAVNQTVCTVTHGTARNALISVEVKAST